MARILVADPDPETRQVLRECLGEEHELVAVSEAAAVRRLLADEPFDVAVVELELPDGRALPLVREIREAMPATQCLVVAAFGSVEDAVAAMRAGASDFLCKPLPPDRVRCAITRDVERARLWHENRALRRALDDRLRLGNLVATDPAMQRVLEQASTVAKTRTTVLITGESGTGKTLLARAIHRASERASGPFVEVNCGALPEGLLESELFGHVKGAFTGAVRDRPGKFEAAQGGTLFLDEIGTSSKGLQVRLLRVLQDRVVERVGDTRTLPVDVRVVLATNLDLEAEVRAGRFRQDLFYRIHVVALAMPPLRERPGDIPRLAERFLRRFADETGRPVRGFTGAALEALCRAAWPGNVRQLENVVERAVVLCRGERIDVEDLPPDFATPAVPGGATPQQLFDDGAPLQPLRDALAAPERALIERALRLHGGNRQQTAASLGINRSTLFNKMRKYGLLEPRDGRTPTR